MTFDRELDIPRALSGRGSEILSLLVQPLLGSAVQYDRVSSYYSPRSLAILLEELAEIWRRGGTVRLIIGFHESAAFAPALREDVSVEEIIVAAVAKALEGDFEELSSLLQEEHRSLLPLIRELIVRKAIHVRLVTPRANLGFFEEKGRWPSPEVGVFHSKFAIVHHGRRPQTESRLKSPQYYRSATTRQRARERFSVITGSFNESRRGYGDNIEDAVLHRSWIDGERSVANYFVDRFEAMWVDAAEDVRTMPFDDEFARILDRVTRRTPPNWFRWKDFGELLRKSPSYAGLALPQLGLLSHQYRTYREGLSRWPIRVLLADEVGLGKTIEAGSIIHYLLSQRLVNRICIFTPASLRYQWQKELSNLFDLKFWVYNSATGECEFEDERMDVGKAPLSGPDHVIVSWHWARLDATEERCRFGDHEMPDLLVVDEAHHARRHETASGHHTRTQLHLLLERMARRTPHVILLTATPFQTSQLDYFSLLELLGIPEWFTPQTLDQFSRWTRGELADNFALMVNQLKESHSSIRLYSLARNRGPEGLREMPSPLKTQAYEEYIDTRGPLRKEDVLTVHPTTLLTIRNTRSALREQGYQFPEAHLQGSDIQVSTEQAKWFNDLEHYIRTRLGRVEAEGNDRRNIGRLRSLFRQRVVSSIQAARDSLSARQLALAVFLESGDTSSLLDTLGEEFDPSGNDEEDATPLLEFERESRNRIKRRAELAKNESYHIDRLLNRLDQLFAEEHIIVDPKMGRLKEIVYEHLQAGRKVLVFSRFTSTTAAVVKELAELIKPFGVGRFDGQHVGVLLLEKSGMDLEVCSRKEIVRNLNTGRIKVLVCSDAASEGLNLHAATVAINVDVPWNPSRVLQRFGRVDRLGQKAGDVYLINMYYPDSIEERMYSVLEDRRVNFMALLGEVPDIISEQQRRMMEDLSRESTTVGLTFQEVEEARRTYARNQFDHIMLKAAGGYPAIPLQVKLLETLKEALVITGQLTEVDAYTIEQGGRRISVNPFDDGYSSLASDIWQSFQDLPREQRRILEVLPLEDEMGTPLALVLRDDNLLLPLATETWPHVFRFFFLGERIPILDLPRFAIDQLEEVLKFLQAQDQWIWPNHSELATISERGSVAPSFGKVRLGAPYGVVPVTGFAVPQADDIGKVQRIPSLVADGYDSKEKLAEVLRFHTRQSEYYAEAAEFLGLVARSGGKYTLTGRGREFTNLPPEKSDSYLARLVQKLPLIRSLLEELETSSTHGLTKEDIERMIVDNSHFTGTTVMRRAQTVVSWLRFLANQTGIVSVNDDIVTLGRATKNS